MVVDVFLEIYITISTVLFTAFISAKVIENIKTKVWGNKMNNSEIIKKDAYPIEKAIETSNKYYIHTILSEIFDALNSRIKLNSESGYYSATINYEYPSFYSNSRIEQVKDVIKNVYEKAGYIVDCENNPHKKNTLLLTVIWVDKEFMGE